MPVVCFAPLQGYTYAAYRRAHHEVVGGIDAYYTPFIRWEHGDMSKRDLRDVSPEANEGVPTVPQVIARDRDEFCFLCDVLQTMGWRRIDLNMGCPFPMQVHAGRGSGLLQHTDRVRDIMDEMRRRSEVSFSVKMRLGAADPDEAFRLLPLLNETPLDSVTLHPRLATQQYKGSPDHEVFARFYEACAHPLIYNGDIVSRQQMEQMLKPFPKLHGVMIGRGLLANPTALSESDGGHPKWQADKVLLLHDKVFCDAMQVLCGDMQVLMRMRAFWQYQQPHLPRKAYKTLMKTASLRTYTTAVASLRETKE